MTKLELAVANALALIEKTEDREKLRAIADNARKRGSGPVADAAMAKIATLTPSDSATYRVTKVGKDGKTPTEIAVRGQLGQWWVETHLGRVRALHDAFVSADRRSYAEPAYRYEPKPRETHLHIDQINKDGLVILTTDGIDGLHTKRTGYVSVVKADNARIEGGMLKVNLGDVVCNVIKMADT